MPKSAIEYFNETQNYLNSDSYLNKDTQTQDEELRKFNKVFGELVKNETANLDNESVKKYMSQFNKEYNPSERKKWAKSPSKWTDQEYVAQVKDIKASPEWEELTDKERNDLNIEFGNEYRLRKLANGESIEAVDYNANQRVADYYNENAKAAVEYLGELAGQHWHLDENQPKEVKDLTWGNAAKAAGKSVARIPGSAASTALGFLGGVTNIAGKATGSEFLQDLGTVMGTGANSLDAVNQGILPPEQKQIEGIKDIIPGMGDRTFGQKVLTGIDQLPEQIGTWIMPGIMAKTAKGAVTGAKALEQASKLPKLGKFAVGAEKSAQLANKLGLHNLNPEKVEKVVGYLGSSGLELSEMYKKAISDQGEVKDPTHMLLMAGIAGYLEDAVPSKLFRGSLKPATRAMLRRDFGKGAWKTSASFIKNLGKDTLNNLKSEGLTELLQTYLEQAAANRNAGGSRFLPIDDVQKIGTLLNKKGIDGVLEEAKHNERLAELVSATILGGLSGGLGNIGSNVANYISYNSSPEGYLERYRENRESLIDAVNNAKTDEERQARQQELETLKSNKRKWEESNSANALSGDLNTILGSFNEMSDPETSEDDLKDSFRNLADLNDDSISAFLDYLQKSGWQANDTFYKNLDRFIKYREDFNFKFLPQAEQNRILKEREEAERQAKLAELERVKAENEAKEKSERFNLGSKMANALLQRAVEMNWMEQDAINKFLRGEQLTSNEENIVNKVFEKYSGQTTDISQALNSELQSLKETEKNLWSQLNPESNTAQKNNQTETQNNNQIPQQPKPVKVTNNQSTVQQPQSERDIRVQQALNRLNQLEQEKIKDEQEKEQLRQQLTEQQKSGSNANVQGQPLQNGKRGFIGNEARLKASDIDTKCNYAVVELSDLQTLSDEENPRQRNDRQAYVKTVSDRAKNLDPDLLIDNSVGAQNGPIVVDQNLKVESGNGRTLSLREAYANRKGEGEYSNTIDNAGYGRADLYRNKLIAEAPKYGISSEQVMQMKEPVLVRIRVADSNINAKDFWAKANNSQQESMSSTETAMVDGEKIKPLLKQFEAIGDIRARSNLEFVRSFLEKICSPYELNSMFTADGKSLSEAGEKRINNAIIAAAYGDSEIVSLLTELGNEDIQTILNGLAMAAPDTAKLMGEAQQGTVHDVDYSKDLADAIRTIKNLRQNPSTRNLIKQFGSVGEVYLRQGTLGDDGLSPTARLFIGVLGNLNNKETISNFLKAVNNAVRNEGSPSQIGLFEENTKPSNEVFVERAIGNMGFDVDAERYEKGPSSVASNDDFHAEDAQGKRYSLGQTENTNTRTPEENYQLLMNQEPIDISINPLSNLVGKEQRTEAKNIYKRLLKIRVKTTDGKTVNFTNTGYKELKNHSANPLTLQIIPNLDELVRNAIYLYSKANHEQKRYNVDQYHYYTVKAQLINPETSKKEDYAVRIVLREDTNGNIFYDGDSTEITKIEKLREQSHRVPNTGNHVAPTNSLIKYFENVNFNKKKKLLDKAQSNHSNNIATPSAISGGSISNLSISENDNLPSYQTEAEKIADDGTTATKEEFDTFVENINKSIKPGTGISFVVMESVDEFNKDKADEDKAPENANALYEEGGRIILFRNRLKTLTRLKQVAAHELLGHAGIKRFLGSRYYRVFLSSIRKLAQRDRSVERLFNQVQNNYRGLYAKESIDMYEELGAHLAELYGRKPESFSDKVHQFFRNIRIMFRNALRNWGIDISLDHLDIEDIFARSRETVEMGYSDEPTYNRHIEERRYSRDRRKTDDKNQLRFFDYNIEDNQDYSETDDYEGLLDDKTLNDFQELHNSDEAEYGDMTDEEKEFDYYYENEAEFPEDYYGKEGWKLIQDYQENGSVIYDILPRILEEDYEFVNDPFAEYTDEDIPAPVQALLNITDNGEFFADLEHELLGAIPNNAVDLLENLKDRIKETFHKSFANKIIRNCDKAIEMIRKGEFKEGVIKPISVEELERQDIKKMPKTDWEIRDEYDKANGIHRGVNVDILGSHIKYSLSNEAKQIKQKAIDNGTFLKAPNGKDSNLNENQWIEARTQKFKDSFGDWELANELYVEDKPLNDKETIKILEKLSKKELINDETGIKAIISRKQRDKLVSMAATRKSIANGFSINTHNRSVAIIDKLFKHASLLIEHNDRDEDPNIKSIKRFVSPVVIEGEPNIAYLTAKESIEHGHRIYSLELTDIKKLEGNLNELINKLRSASSFDTSSIKKKLDSVNIDRSKLDSNGEPLAKYITEYINNNKRSYSLGTDGQRLTNPESDNLEDLYNNLMNGSEENSQDNDFVKDINALGKSEDRRYALGGERAKTANIARLNEAKRMLADGEDKKTVWQKTGWYIAKDGKPRFEIKDKISFKRGYPYIVEQCLQYNYPTRLSWIINNKPLFKAYPFLEDYQIYFYNELDDTAGYFDPKNKGIHLNLKREKPNTANSKYDVKRTLIHELQHAIQNYEGFAKGSSVENEMDKLKKSNYDNSRLAEQNIKQTIEDLNNPTAERIAWDYVNLFREFRKAELDFINQGTEETFDKLTKLGLSRKELRDQFVDLNKSNEPLKIIEKNIVDADKKEIEERLLKKAHDNYYKHYGEGEARAVENRLDYADFERDEIMPEDDFDYNIDESYIEGVEDEEYGYPSKDTDNQQRRYSLVSDPKLLNKLESEPTVKVYRAMQLIDGKLYPPMAAKIEGKRVKETEFNRWYQADENPDIIIWRENSKGEKVAYFKLNKDDGDSIEARYAPYWHTSRTPLNDQFSGAWNRHNLVTVECEIPESELTSGYMAEFAEKPVGETEWHEGPVANRLGKVGKPRKVILSRWNKITRIVPDGEVADKIAETLKDTGIGIPENTVTPSLLEELKKRDVIIEPPEKGKKKKSKTRYDKFGNRYDGKPIRFSLSSPVEHTKNLIAVHNLHEDELLESLKLGGLPMPSIAIVKDSMGHNSFGEISVVFDKNTINPKFFRSNKVYSGDAYTPSFPKLGYKIDTDKCYKIRKRIEKELGSELVEGLGYSNLDEDNIKRAIDNVGENKIADYYKDKPVLKALFLKDKGIGFDVEYTEQKFDYRYDNDFIKKVAEKYGKEKINRINEGYEEIGQDIIDDLIEMANDHFNQSEKGKEILSKYKDFKRYGSNNFGWGQAQNIIYGAVKYLNRGLNQIADKQATEANINDALKGHEEEYSQWLNNLFDGIVLKKGIRNNKDTFTSIGNRRSFESLHYEYNLENIVKSMKQEDQQGANSFGGYDLFGSSTTMYDSIKSIKQDSDRLREVPEEEYDNIRKEFRNRFNDITEGLANHKSWQSEDSVKQVLLEAVVKCKTKPAMERYISKEFEGWSELKPDTIDDLIELVKDIRKMPTGYFEAKPQRAVGLDEIEAVIIPNTTSQKTIEAINNAGIKTVTYDTSDKSDRLKKLNEVADSKEGIRFSLGSKQKLDLNGEEYSVASIEDSVKDWFYDTFESDMDGLSDTPIDIKNLKVIGSRAKGNYNTDSDLDVILEYDDPTDSWREDDVFNMLNEVTHELNGVKVDINPIKKEDSGTIEEWLNRNYDYNKNTEDSGRRYSLNQFLDSGKRFVDVQANQEEFDGLSDKQKINKAIKIIKDKFAQKVIGIDNRVFVNSSQAKEYGYPPKEINDKDIINAKMRASTELDNLVDAGTNFRTEEDGKDGHIHPDAKNFEYFDVLFKVGDQLYKGVINIKNNNRGRLFYDITKIENVTKDQTDSTGNIPAFGFLRDISMPDEKSSDKFSIAENSNNRNTAENTDQTETQQFKRWFGKSIMTEDGRAGGKPKVFYHGTDQYGFDVFRDNSFFTDDEQFAKRYETQRHQDYKPGTYEVYLSIEKPFDIRNAKDRKIFTEYRNGHKPTQTDSGAMEWTDFDYDDLTDYLKDNYPNKYDGYVIQETYNNSLSYVPFEKSQIKSATDNIGTFDRNNDSIRYSLGSTIEQQRKQFEDYVDGKMGIKLSDDEKDTIKAILETDDDADLDLNDIPTFGERLGNAKESLKTFLGQLITGLIGDTESRADRKKAPYLWQKDHSTENVVETPYEISRRTKIEQGMKTREEEDRLVLKHLDADKNLFTGLIRKWTKPGALQDWMLKKASRILAPFQIMKPVEQLLFTVAENIMWDEAKQQMVIAPYRDTEYDKQTNRPIGYKYDPNEKNGRLALDIYNNKLNDEFKAIIKERSIANNKFREDFVNRVVPFEQAKLYLARFGRKRLEGASKKIVDGNDQQAYSYITKLKGVIDDLDYNNLISQYDQIKSIPDEQLGRNSAFINSIIGELAGNPAITTNGIDAKLNWLTTNKGLYGYAHHLVSIDPETGNGKPFNALGKISHPWIESIAGDRRGRKGDNSEYRSLLRADLERNRKEAEAEAANRWMEATENTYGITLEEAKNLEKLQKQGKGPGMPEGYEHRHKVIANFGKFRGKVIYLPDETFEAYQMVRDNRSLDSMKQFKEFIQKMNNLNGRINEAMLWHPGKAMRDIMAGPFHLLEFLRDWSMKHPTEINDAAKAIWHGVKNSVSPEYWQSHSPESMGEYSESVIYQTQEGQSPTFGFIDSLFNYFQRAIPVGRTLEAMYKEINFAGGADIPLKRIFTTVGEELADKRGLTGQERERFIYDLVNDYAFDTGDLPEILGWLRGKKPDSKSQALGMISRATVPFMGYATRMIKQMITDPVTKGAIPLAKRAFGNVDSDSNLRSEISEISRPFFWLMLKALIAAGLGGILPPPTAEEIQDMPGVPPSARTHGRFYVGDSDKGERWMSTKGLGQLETAYIMDDYLKGKSDIIDFSSEFLTIHPVMKYIANLSGLYSEYDRKVPFTTQTGKMLAGLIFPELTTRFTEDINKLVRAYMQVGTADRRKQTFIQAFIEKLFGIPAGEVQFDKEGHLRLSDPAIETMKMFGINIREIPFDTIEETTRAEASRIANDSKKIEKLRNYRSGKYAAKSEQEFLKQDFGGDFSSVAEAENYYSNLAERERKVVDTATKLHNKGHWTDLEDVAREKKELAAEKKKQQNEGKPTKRRRTTRHKKAERPLLNDDLNYINNDIRKNIYNSREEEYQDLYDKLMQNNKKHNPRRGVAGQLERLLKEME